MKTSFGDRLRMVMKNLGFTGKNFSKILDENPSTLSGWLTGGFYPTAEFLMKLKNKFPQVSLDYLLTGEGEEFEKTDSIISDEVHEKVGYYDSQVNKDAMIRELENEIRNLKTEISKRNFIIELIRQSGDLKITDKSTKQAKKTVLIS